MAAPKLKYAIGNAASTTNSSSVSNSDTSVPLTSSTNFQAAPTPGEGMVLLDEGNATEELAYSTGLSGSNLTTPLANRGLEGGSAQPHTQGSSVKGILSAGMWNDLIDALLNILTQSTGAVDTTKIVTPTGTQTLTNKTLTSPVINTGISGTAIVDEDNMISDSATKVPTQQSVKAYVDTNASIITTSKFAPQGFLINGKISVSVSSNNITVAIKGMDGNDPSASNPVRVRIGDTVRSITSALSVTKNAGTNWFNSGSSELATNEIDYFVYLGYNATDGVVIGFARIPYATRYGDFSTTTTNDRYCAISTITTAASTDYYELIGRFAATLSATASFNWSVPTFTAVNLIQRPIYDTRWLTCTPTWTGFSANPTNGVYRYQISYNKIICKINSVTAGTSNATSMTLKAPMFNANVTNANSAGYSCQVTDSGTVQTNPGNMYLVYNTNDITFEKTLAGGTFTNSGNKSVTFANFIYEI